ncbi:MAG: gliding motility-associated C-terminal domain-containing protein [Sporocytophaga sp.]|nr:gliding motility-associated C-terminal domain-containing protein [Sporocytophaga sp.]
MILDYYAITPKALSAFYWRIATGTHVGYKNDCNVESLRNAARTPALWYKPRTGKGFVILQTCAQYPYDGEFKSIRNYISVKLTSPLEAGCKYKVSFFAKLITDDSLQAFTGPGYGPTIASDGLGAYLSVDTVYRTGLFPNLFDLNPQIENPSGNILTDSINYTEISGIYTAIGGEQYITIGNFRSNAETKVFPEGIDGNSKYLVDDVSVTKLVPDFDLGTSKEICEDSTIIIKGPSDMDYYDWSTGEHTQDILVNSGGKYWLDSKYSCLNFSDTIEITIKKRFNEKFSIGNDTFLCDISEGFKILAPSGFDNYKWSTGQIDSLIEVFKQGTYNIEANYVCGTERDTIQISVYNPPDDLINPSSDTTICLGDDLLLRINENVNVKSANWNTGINLPSLNVNQAGRYSVTVITDQNCILKDSIDIETISLPEVELGTDILTCKDQTVSLSARYTNADSIVWENHYNKPFREISTSGKYWIQVSNKCFTSTDTVNITFEDCTPFIPNLITPNGDDRNDYFVIETKIVRPLKLEIYNRWGKKVYENDVYLNDWQGNDLEKGIYFYYLNDETLNRRYKGWLEILR